MKTRAFSRLMPTLAVLPSVFALAACGTTTVDPASAEKLIKSQIGKFGPIVAKSVSCPNNVKKKAGVTFNCKVVLESQTTRQTASGTITIHLIKGGNSGEFNSSDIHVK